MFKTNQKMVVVLTLKVLLLSEVLSGKVEYATDLIQKDVVDWKTLVENLKATLSPDIDPCTDFHSYVCTKYNDTESNDFKNMLILEPYLEKGEGLSESEMKAKHYMHTCMHKTEENVEKFVKIFNFGKSIGGWPAFDPNWNSENFDWQAAIAEFASYDIWLPIYATFMESSYHISNYLYVRVLFTDFDIFRDKVVQTRFNKTLEKIGVKDVNAVLSDAMQFENDYRASGLPTSWYGQTVLTNYSTLKVEIPELDWDKYIEIKERRKLPDDFNVHLQKSDIVRTVLKTISKMEPRVLANYLFCQFIVDLPNTEIQPSKKDCWDETHKTFQTVLSQTILNKFVSENTRDKVLPLTHSFVDTLYKYIPPSPPTLGMIKVKYLKEILEDYFTTLTDESIISEYKDLAIDSDSYLLNYYSALRYNSLKYTEQHWDQKWKRSSQIGEIIARDFPYQIYKVNTKLWTAVSSYIASQYFNNHLEAIYENYKFNNSFSDCFGKFVEKQSVRNAITLQILTNSFSNWISKNIRDIQADTDLLEEHGLNLKKALFVGVMQMWCRESSLNEVNSIFSKFQEFGDTFECPVGAAMNPSEKCDIDKFKILD